MQLKMAWACNSVQSKRESKTTNNKKDLNLIRHLSMVHKALGSIWILESLRESMRRIKQKEKMEREKKLSKQYVKLDKFFIYTFQNLFLFFFPPLYEEGRI